MTSGNRNGGIVDGSDHHGDGREGDSGDSDGECPN